MTPVTADAEGSAEIETLSAAPARESAMTPMPPVTLMLRLRTAPPELLSSRMPEDPLMTVEAPWPTTSAGWPGGRPTAVEYSAAPRRIVSAPGFVSDCATASGIVVLSTSQPVAGATQMVWALALAAKASMQTSTAGGRSFRATSLSYGTWHVGASPSDG